MDTVSSLQEQINDLKQRMEALEKRTRKRTWTKHPPLTPEEAQKAISQILPLLTKLNGQTLTPRAITQHTALLRLLGIEKVREYVEAETEQGLFKKEGRGKSVRYGINPIREFSEEDQSARNYILNLTQGIKLDTIPKGKWATICTKLTNAFDYNPTNINEIVQGLIASNKIPGIQTLLT